MCFVHFHVQMRFSLQRRAIFPHRTFKKCSRTRLFFFYILTWKCTSRHSGMQFFHIGPSESALGPGFFFLHFDLKMYFSPQRHAIFPHRTFRKCSRTRLFFLHFDLKMHFSPQRHAIFPHRTFRKCSRTLIFLAFSLQNVLHGVRFFDIARTKRALDLTFLRIFTWKCASRHSGVHFFDIRTSKSAPNLTCFVHFHSCNFWFLLWPHDSAPAALTGLLFDWLDTGIIEKTQHVATSLTFGADVSSFF